MSFTNETQNYHLPQWVGSDKPTWLVDLNGAFSDIDTGMAATQAQSDATDVVVSGHTSAITALQNTTSDQSTAITGLRTDVDHNTGDISTINSLIGNGEPTTTDKTIIGAINELNEEIQTSGATMDKRYFVFIGDSYAEVLDGSDNYLDLIARNLGVTSSQYKQFHQSGVGFTNVNSQGTFKQVLQAQASTLASVADKITDVVVCGGANDYDTWPTTLTAIGDFVSYVKATYKNAVVSIGHIGRPTGTRSALTNSNEKSLIAYRNCGRYGAKYLHGVEYILHDTRQQSDGNHPNVTGVNSLGREIAQAIVSGSCDVRYTINPTWTFNSTQTTYSAWNLTGNIYEELDNDVSSFTLRQGNAIELTLASTGANAALPVVKIATPDNKVMFGGGSNDFLVQGVAYAHASGTILGSCPCGVGLDADGDLSIFIKNAYRDTDFSTATGFYIPTVGKMTCASSRC